MILKKMIIIFLFGISINGCSYTNPKTDVTFTQTATNQYHIVATGSQVKSTMKSGDVEATIDTKRTSWFQNLMSLLFVKGVNE